MPGWIFQAFVLMYNKASPMNQNYGRVYQQNSRYLWCVWVNILMKYLLNKCLPYKHLCIKYLYNPLGNMLKLFVYKLFAVIILSLRSCSNKMKTTYRHVINYFVSSLNHLRKYLWHKINPNNLFKAHISL